MKILVCVATLALLLVCTAPSQAALFDHETKLTAVDASALGGFGISVAINGSMALVGAPGIITSPPDSAYLFDATTGNQLAKFTAVDAAARGRFGTSVAISDNTAIVGASGSAYLFDVTTGNQLAKLTAPDATADDLFGTSVAISGNTAIVGASGDDDGGDQSGSAYLFDVTTGNQLAKLTAADAEWGDWFGASVAISGNTAIVGAWSDGGGSNSGSAYLFDVTTGNQLAKLTAADAAVNDLFGRSVAISGNTAIVGAYNNDDGGSNSGSAYLFDVTTGNQLAKLTATDAAADDRFGISVAISGNMALVGAAGDNDGGSNSGSAYLFDVATGNQLAKLTATDAAAYDQFGHSVAISGNTALVGAVLDNNGSGSAYLYKNIPEPSSLLLGAMACIGFFLQRNR